MTKELTRDAFQVLLELTWKRQQEEARRLYTYEQDFADFVRDRETGEALQVDEDMYFYWLEVLPPTGANNDRMRMQGMGGVWKRPDGQEQRFNFAFAEGAEPITIFWEFPRGQYFGQKTDVINLRGL